MNLVRAVALRQPRFRADAFRTEHIADPQIGSLAGKISELDPGCRRNVAVWLPVGCAHPRDPFLLRGFAMLILPQAVDLVVEQSRCSRRLRGNGTGTSDKPLASSIVEHRSVDH
jgi:hypothetical protein